MTIDVQGTFQPRFKLVADAFAANFESLGEVGAAFALQVDGELVVDIWGGHADAARTRPWERDTIVNVYSTTKGMAALCANMLADRGRLDIEAPVARYWPEFAEAGKTDLPVRYLLTHEAGLPAVRRPLEPADLWQWDRFAGALAAETPWWTPGEGTGYHAITFGHLVGEVIRRISGKTPGTFFREQVAEPLGADFWIGLPASEDARVAEMIPADPPAPGERNLLLEMMSDPESMAGKAFANPPLPPDAVNSRDWRGAEIPAGNGHGNARALATVYGTLALDGNGAGRLLSKSAVERAGKEHVAGDDLLLQLYVRRGLGYWLSTPRMAYGPNEHSFGHAGAGGSLGFADPDARLGFGYTMNKMRSDLDGDLRTKALIAAAYDCL
jgi:CubicO group peptidase (beta-lactamase class C family)